MTHFEKNCKIAVFCGWCWRMADDGSGRYWHNPSGKIKPDDVIPDYMHDLNAIRQAELAMTL